MKLTTSEIKFMNIIWKEEPVSSGILVKLCNENFNWKKSTTYTFLKRLQERGAIVNNNSIVSSLVSKSVIQKEESTDLIKNLFDDSLFTFVKSYMEFNNIETSDLDELKKIFGDSSKERKIIRFEV